VGAAYGDTAMSKSQINRIIKAVKEGKNTADQRHSSAKKTKRTGDVLASTAAAVVKDRRIMVRELAATHGLPIGTVHAILKEDLGLVKTKEVRPLGSQAVVFGAEGGKSDF
jgi:hypothetical protein